MNRPVLQRKKVPIGSKPPGYYYFRNHDKVLGTTLRAASSSMHMTVSRRPTLLQSKVLELRETIPVIIWLRDPLDRLACAYKLFKGAYDFGEWTETAISKWNTHWSPQTSVHSYDGIFLPNIVLSFLTINETWPQHFPDHPLPHTKNFKREQWDDLKKTLTSIQMDMILDHYKEDLALYRKITEK